MKLRLPRSVVLPRASSDAFWLPRPGIKRGPCLEPCSHAHCAGMREVAALVCSVCGCPLGWETPIYQTKPNFKDPPGQVRLMHGLCVATLRYRG